MKQVYTFIKTKEKEEAENARQTVDELAILLVKSPNLHLQAKLRQSIAAKAANRALLKWHARTPLAGLSQLEAMYKKCFDFFYNKLKSKSIQKEEENFKTDEPSDTSISNNDQHKSHFQEYLNLLDFLKRKTAEIEKKTSNEPDSDERELEKLMSKYLNYKRENLVKFL